MGPPNVTSVLVPTFPICFFGGVKAADGFANWVLAGGPMKFLNKKLIRTAV